MGKLPMPAQLKQVIVKAIGSVMTTFIQIKYENTEL
jgi:hypothetical protein